MKNAFAALALVAALSTAPITLTPAFAQTSTTTQATAPAAIVKRFVNAVNSNNTAAVRAMFAPNAWSAYGEGGARKTGDALLAWLESDILRVNGKIAVTRETVNGNTVTIEGRYTSTGWSGNARYVFTVQNGLIASWTLL